MCVIYFLTCLDAFQNVNQYNFHILFQNNVCFSFKLTVLFKHRCFVLCRCSEREREREKRGGGSHIVNNDKFSWTEVVGSCNQYHRITSAEDNSPITSSSH